VKVELSGEANAQVREIDAWWRENRRASPDLFAKELAQALTALSHSPTLGSPYEAGSRRVRRLLLRRTHYHLYFLAGQDRLFIVAVWSAFRGEGPAL
jgi:plasmid stabilization system protein ParE